MYEQPNSRWVAGFIGEVNLLEGRVVEAGPAGTVVETAAAGVVRAAPCAGRRTPGATVWIALRPEKVQIALAPPQMHDENCVAGQVAGSAISATCRSTRCGSTAARPSRRRSPTSARQVDQPIRALSRVWLTWADDAGVVLTR